MAALSWCVSSFETTCQALPLALIKRYLNDEPLSEPKMYLTGGVLCFTGLSSSQFDCEGDYPSE